MLRNAIKQRDYATADRIAGQVMSSSRLRAWDFYPFSDFIANVADLNDPTFEAGLDEWVARNSSDALPLLIRGQYHLDLAWFIRGERFSNEIQRRKVRNFEYHRARALADVDAALALEERNPYAHFLKLRVLRGGGASQAQITAFGQGIEKYPGYYPLYTSVLGTLRPEWGGSVDAMYGFVDRYAGRAPDKSPLKLLYLDLYANVVGSAAVACSGYRPDYAKASACADAYLKTYLRPALKGQVAEALGLYDHLDRYEFNRKVKDSLLGILDSDDGGRYSSEILELAAARMHTTTQLKPDGAAQRNYAIDEALGKSWYLKGFYDNALAKYESALEGVRAAPFPSAAEKDLELGGIYEELGRTQDKLHHYGDMIDAVKAALVLKGQTDLEHYICVGYYRLKDNAAAVAACTATIDRDPSNLYARYWRGTIFYETDQPDKALSDLKRVADSENYFRGSAAIAMSMIHFNRKDLRGALAVLNRYAYLYDAELGSEEDAAVAYNNRCYAYMELGDLKKALDDCRASLKHGNIPDAYRKEEELTKRLGAAVPKI